MDLKLYFRRHLKNNFHQYLNPIKLKSKSNTIYFDKIRLNFRVHSQKCSGGEVENLTVFIEINTIRLSDHGFMMLSF